MPAGRIIRIGARGSKLARWQSEWVAERLQARGVGVEIIDIATRGDVQQQGSVASLGIQGVFTKEIQSALLSGQIDLAVHSLKDLPTEQVAGLVLAATPPRVNPADALVTAAAGQSLAALPEGARVGTGSLRRRAQLLHLRSDLKIAGIRGNVDTRLRKLDDGEYDAIVLAAAGLTRLGLDGRITELLAPPRMLPAPGQGALAIECREDNAEAIRAASPLDDPETRQAVAAERVVLAALHGGCSAPIAAWGCVADGRLHLDALVADLDGSEVLRSSASEPLADPANGDAAQRLGQRVADELLAQGAAAIVARAREGA